MRGWRLLGAFWAALGGTTVAGGLVLAALGPPRHTVPAGHRGDAVADARRPSLPAPARPPVTRRTPAVAVAPRASFASAGAGSAWPGTPGAIPRADPSMLAADPDAPDRALPVPGPDGRRAATVYAAAVPRVLPGQARLALVITGIGLDRHDSLAAASLFPPAVTFAISPYGDGLAAVADAAHARGHETLASVPMEPADSPLADEGAHALDAGAEPAANARDLDWSLSATGAYVGATGADVSGDGERFSAMTGLFRTLVVDALDRRGLLYVSPGPLPPHWPGSVPVAQADIVVPAIPTGAALDEALGSLAATALRQGHALGIVGPPIPAITDRLLAFLRTLPARGIVRGPASALAGPPDAVPDDDATPSLTDAASVGSAPPDAPEPATP